jgi:hypothetical protein
MDVNTSSLSQAGYDMLNLYYYFLKFARYFWSISVQFIFYILK